MRTSLKPLLHSAPLAARTPGRPARLLRRLTALLFCMMLKPMSAYAELPKTVTLAATEWCPYSCAATPAQPGIVHEYITQVLADAGIALTIKYYPWSRAIQEVANQRSDGLLTAVPEEAPHLRFTSVATMTYSNCLFSRAEDSWQYQTLDSLKDRFIGVQQDYSYGEPFDRYLNGANDNVFIAKSEKGLKQLFSMLQRGRIDAFLSEKNVAIWEANRNAINMKSIKISGCGQAHPFYLAFNPNKPWSEALITQLNHAFSDAENRQKLEDISKRYIGY